VYFTFNPMEAHDVSHVRIQFIERQARQYRVELSAIVYRVFAEPTVVCYSGWINVAQEQASDAEPSAGPERGGK
jgi:hypothetical protein